MGGGAPGTLGGVSVCAGGALGWVSCGTGVAPSGKLAGAAAATLMSAKAMMLPNAVNCINELSMIVQG